MYLQLNQKSDVLSGLVLTIGFGDHLFIGIVHSFDFGDPLLIGNGPDKRFSAIVHYLRSTRHFFSAIVY